MRWDETTASQCRYGEVAERIFRDAEIVWEHSEADYQGSANILARMPDGAFVHYEWTYGSCSGCDEWEARDLDDDAIEAEMRGAMAVLADEATCARYLRLEGEFDHASFPTANSPQNGSIPGMLRYLGGGAGDEFRAMGEAFVAWRVARGTTEPANV